MLQTIKEMEEDKKLNFKKHCELFVDYFKKQEIEGMDLYVGHLALILEQELEKEREEQLKLYDRLREIHAEELLKLWVAGLCEKVGKMKKKVCGCEESELGYHTKECNLVPYGYNDALSDVLKVIK